MKLKFTLSHFAALLILFLGANSSWSQTSYTFTSCGATGSSGPTQTQANSAYTGTNLAGNVTITGGIQYWTVPATGNYKISAYGAQGGGANGGLGALIEGEFTLTQNQVIRILVGQQGITQSGNPNSVGGGGGTFVIMNPAATTSDILVIAGGGGGCASALYPTKNGNIGPSGNNGVIDAGVANPDGAGGTGGNGGNKSVVGCSLDRGAGGGGFLTNGGSICQTVGIGDGGSSFLNGGQGGTGTGPGAQGGFGGGGATWQTGFRGSGGGGGFSGGGAGQINSVSPNHAGGGGGSYNNGTNPQSTAGVQTGDGLVVITSLTSSPNDAGISSVPGFTPLCSGTYPLQAVVNNFGNNLISGVTVGWSVNGVVQTPYTLTNPLDTVNGAGANSQLVTLGNVILDDSTIVKVWTSLPNNVTDTVNGNDTSAVTFLTMHVVPIIANGINCNGGSNGVAQASVTHNTGGSMTYSWSNGATGQYLIGVQAGTYILTGTNGTCTDTASFVMTEPSAVTYTNVSTGVPCFGDTTGTATLTISGGTPTYSVSWAAGGTGVTNNSLPGGTNNFTITDGNGCSTNGTLTITQPTALSLTTVITPESFGNDGEIDLTVTGGTPSYTYLWSNSATTEDLTSLVAGNYDVTVTDGNGCSATLSNTVNSVVGIEEKNNEFGFELYPNPSNGQFVVTLSNPSSNNSIQVFDVLGKKIFETSN
ncbi:MAG: glycine-rich protein, partial [Bacteroidota bacterium]